MKKVRKTTGPLRYDLNQIPYDYIVEVRNRFKGLYLKNRLPENYGWKFYRRYVSTFYITFYRRPPPRKRNPKQNKTKNKNGLQIAKDGGGIGWGDQFLPYKFI